jgi:hypothetical protein
MRNKLELSEQEINDIAEDLECGMRVFLNIETKEIKRILDWDELASDELWETELAEIEENPGKYIEFSKMDRDEGFRLMKDFVETVKDKELKKKLELGLRLSKPFRNFKDIIDYDQSYRQRWFDFKHNYYIDLVKTQLENYNSGMDKI